MEIIKPRFGEGIDQESYQATINIFEILLKSLHPFVPFITEELWHHLAERKEDDDIIVAEFPQAGEYDEQLISDFEFVKEVISGIREFRNSNNLGHKEEIKLQILAEKKSHTAYDEIAKKLCKIESIDYLAEKPQAALSFLIRSTEYFVPFDEKIDLSEEIEKAQKELDYQMGFLKSVMGKLGNERFVQNAPAQVVDIENKKKADAELKIKVLEEKLDNLKKQA